MKIEVSESLKPDEIMIVSWPGKEVLEQIRGDLEGLAEEMVLQGYVVKVKGVTKP